MNLRWLVKQDGSRVLQVKERIGGPRGVSRAVWTDIPEVREEKDPIMTDQENGV